MRLSKRDKLLSITTLGLMIILLLRGYFVNYLPLKKYNKWTSGIVLRKSKSAQSSRNIYFKYCVQDSCYFSSNNTLIFDKVILDSVKYIVAYNPDKPSQSKILLDLPTVEAELGSDLDSLKSIYNRELSFWRDF